MRTVFAQITIALLLPALTWARVELTPCKNGIPPEQQIQLGQKAVQQVYQQMPVLPDSSPVTRYIQQLGAKLAAQAPGERWPYNFHVANVAEINAFALPGGSVFVNLGTIQAAANESQLAGVMAHEISHVVLQHSVCNAVKQQKVGLIAGLGQLAAGAILGGAVGSLAQQGIGLTAGLGFLKMSRGAEKEADLEGVGILYDAGYDPRGMSEFFETLQQKYGAGGAQFMSDHPNPGNRSEYVNAELKSFPPKTNYVTNTPDFTRIKDQVSGMRAYTAQQIANGQWRRDNANSTVSSGVNQGTAAAPANIDLNTSGPWRTFQGSTYSLEAPGTWQTYGNQDAAMIAPEGGVARSADSGAGGVVFGLMVDRYQPNGRTNLDGAVDELLSEINRNNPGLQPGRMQNVNVGGVSGRSIEFTNPNANGNRGERDWLVAVPDSQGTLRYFVFVAPTNQYDRARSTFNRIYQSIRVR